MQLLTMILAWRGHVRQRAVDSEAWRLPLSENFSTARASLEELRLDYEDFLRQRVLPKLEPDHPVLQRFKAKRCASLEEVREWLAQERGRRTDERGLAQTNMDLTLSLSVGNRPCGSVSESALVANAALSLLNLCCYLLDRQLAVQAAMFEKEGGFTERLYRVRSKSRWGRVD